MTSLPRPSTRADPAGSPVVARTVALHDPGTLLGLLPDRGRPDRAVQLGAPRRGPGRLGTRAGVHRPRPRPVRARPRRGGATSSTAPWCATRSPCPAPGRSPSARSRMPRTHPPARPSSCPRSWWAPATAGGGSPPSAPATSCPPPSCPTQSSRASPQGVRVRRRRAGARPSGPGRWAARCERITGGSLDKVVLARDLRVSAEAADRRPLAARPAGRALRHDVGLRRRRPRGRDPRDAGAAREGPGHLPGPGRHDPPHR